MGKRRKPPKKVANRPRTREASPAEPEGPPSRFLWVVVLVVLGSLVLFGLGLNAAIHQKAPAQAGPDVRVTYRMTGAPEAAAPKTVKVTYADESGKHVTSQVTLPWEHSFPGRMDLPLRLAVESQETVKAEIVVNELVVQQGQTSDGTVILDHRL